MDQVEEIKKKLDVVSLISSYLTMKKAGKNYKACCPFHKEKTASFMVSPEKQIWYCFGCNQGGDIFTFVEKMEGLDFVGALHLLADKAGIILDRQDFVKKSEKDKYFEILELARKFYAFLLNEHKSGELAKKYLLERGLNQKTIENFSLGMAPDSPEILKSYLVKKGFSLADIEAVGLISKNSSGRVTDKFRDRIVFPIKNTNGKVVGFSGRTYRPAKNPNFTPPKYLNSPQTTVYDKSSVIYGLPEAKEAIREKDLVIIVEGQMDVVSSHQASVTNVVASSGTALTEKQLEILSRYTSNIAFCFDSDEAGNLAMKRAFELSQFSDINLKAIVLNDAKDPDELIKKDPKLWLEAASSPIPIYDFYYSVLMKKNGGGATADEKKKIAQEFIPIISNIGSEIEKAHWIKKISNDLGVNEKYIIEALNKIKRPEQRETGDIDSPAFSIKIPKESLLLTMLVFYPKKMEEFFQKIKIDDLFEEKGKKLYNILFDWHNKGEKENISLEYIKSKVDSKEQKELDLLFFLAMNFFESLEEKDAISDIDNLTSGILQNKKEKRKKEIEIEITSLDKVKNKEKVKELLRELQGLI
ncbi:MAG: DNA primase [Patescibacteria group bacterium]|nr:DNA primase [Patescibacteria group bacterium]